MSNSVAPWTVAHQVPLSKGFLRQENWIGFSSPSPGDLPNPKIKPASPALAGGLFTIEPPGKPKFVAATIKIQIYFLATFSHHFLFILCVCSFIPCWNRTALIKISLFTNHRNLTQTRAKMWGCIFHISGTSKRWSWLLSHLGWGPHQSKRVSVSDLLPLYRIRHFYNSHAFSGKTLLFQGRILICSSL